MLPLIGDAVYRAAAAMTTIPRKPRPAPMRDAPAVAMGAVVAGGVLTG